MSLKRYKWPIKTWKYSQHSSHKENVNQDHREIIFIIMPKIKIIIYESMCWQGYGELEP